MALKKKSEATTPVRTGIGYSPLTERVYLGKQNAGKGMWVGEKRDITQDFLAVVFEYFEVNTSRVIIQGDKKFLICNVENNPAGLKKIINYCTKQVKKMEDGEKIS